MHGIIGAVDGTHIKITAPPITDEDYPPHAYRNKKELYSINVMLVSYIIITSNSAEKILC